MRIAVPLDENQTGCMYCAWRVRLIFCSVKTATDTIVENPAAAGPGRCRDSRQRSFWQISGADTLITVRCGENAGEVFKAADMKIYQSVT